MRRILSALAIFAIVLSALASGASASTPTNQAASINSGATYTNSLNVVVAITAKHCGGSADDQWKMADMQVEARNGSAGAYTKIYEAGVVNTLNDDWFTADGTTGCAAGAAKTNSFAWTLAAGADGPRTVELQFKHGSNAVPASDTITLDTTVPTVAITSPADAAVTGDTAVDVVVSASDATSGVGSVAVDNQSDAVNAYTASLTSGTANNGSWTANGVALVCGANVLQASATDNATNVGTSASITVTRTCSDTGRGAPAIANEYLRDNPAVVSACEATYNNAKNWRGKVISAVAHEFGGQDGYSESDVHTFVDTHCSYSG